MVLFQLGLHDHCVRASPITKTYDEARHRCVAEGGDLYPVLNQDYQDKMKAFIEKKRTEWPKYYQVS